MMFRFLISLQLIYQMILPMHKVIVSDTSCFIILSSIDELSLLQKLYGTIITTQDIAMEYGENLPNWVEIVIVKDKQKQQLLEMQLDKGESSAIALALETANCTLILDDLKARKIAHQLNVSFTGTLGIIIKAKQKGIIDAVKPIIEKIKQTNFRISPELELQALKEAKE
jgi:predicted nucleic acid-binding protein